MCPLCSVPNKPARGEGGRPGDPEEGAHTTPKLAIKPAAVNHALGGVLTPSFPFRCVKQMHAHVGFYEATAGSAGSELRSNRENLKLWPTP